MIRTPKFPLAVLCAITLGGVAAALADDQSCEAPVANWRPRSAVVKLAEDKGWQVDRIKVDDGCYELRVTDAQGRRMRVTVDPASLEVLETRVRGEGHERGERRGRESERHGRRHHDEREGDDGEGQGTAPQDGAQAPAPPPADGLIGKPKAEIR